MGKNEREPELVGDSLSIAATTNDGGYSPCNRGQDSEGGHFGELVKEYREGTVDYLGQCRHEQSSYRENDLMALPLPCSSLTGTTRRTSRRPGPGI